jgi:hypothetical protein
MVSQLKLTDFWNEPPQRGKKEGQEELYNTCIEARYNSVRFSTCGDRQRRNGKKSVKATNGVKAAESISYQVIDVTKPTMSPMMSLLLRITGLELRLETLDKELRELRTYLFGVIVISLLLKLLGF